VLFRFYPAAWCTDGFLFLKLGGNGGAMAAGAWPLSGEEFAPAADAAPPVLD